MLLETSKASSVKSSASSRRSPPALILALLCLPSLLFVWHNRDVPHFGVLQDDGVYFVDGKQLAEGSGYRVLSLPAQPYDTRYPPLYPLYLSIAWRLIPSFPANLPLAVMLSWLSLPVVVVLIYRWCLRHAFPTPITWLVVALFALNPYVLFFVSNLVSEVFFMMFLFGTILMVERREQPGWRAPLLAGIVAGAGYLARTVGIVLLPMAIVYYIWKKRTPKIPWVTVGSFMLGMLPAVLAWTVWSRLHVGPGRDVVTINFTNYLAVYYLNVGWDNLGVILWHNLSTMLESFGSLIFPQVIHGLLAKFVLQPLGVASILGCVRMARRGYAGLYILFAGAYVTMLMFWPYVPNQRYILPLAPLLLAGFCFEMAHLGQLFRTAFGHRDRSQRIVAYAFAGLMITILAGGLGFQAYMGFSVVPELARNDRSNAREFGQFYQWIADNLPPGATVMWENEVRLYLATGHRGTNHAVLPRVWYATDGDDGEAERYKRIDDYAREQHLDYVAIPKIGLQRNEDVLRVVAANTNLERIHEESAAILYRVKTK